MLYECWALFHVCVNTWFICCFSAYAGFMLPQSPCVLLHIHSLFLCLVRSFPLSTVCEFGLCCQRRSRRRLGVLYLFCSFGIFCAPIATATMLITAYSPKWPPPPPPYHHTHAYKGNDKQQQWQRQQQKCVDIFCCCCFCCAFPSVLLYMYVAVYVCKCLCLAGVAYVFKLSSRACQRWQHACTYTHTYICICM